MLFPTNPLHGVPALLHSSKSVRQLSLEIGFRPEPVHPARFLSLPGQHCRNGVNVPSHGPSRSKAALTCRRSMSRPSRLQSRRRLLLRLRLRLRLLPLAGVDDYRGCGLDTAEDAKCEDAGGERSSHGGTQLQSANGGRDNAPFKIACSSPRPSPSHCPLV